MHKRFSILGLLFLVFALLTPAHLRAEAEFVEQAGLWEIYLYKNEGGWFDYCGAIRQTSDVELFLVGFRPEGSFLGFYNENWQIPEGESYEVVLQIDNGTPFSATVSSLGNSIVVEGDATQIIPDLKQGNKIFIHTQTVTLEYPLYGAIQALSAAQSCLRRYSSSAVANPFAPPEPQSSTQSEEAVGAAFSPWRTEPILDLQIFNLLFERYRENEVDVLTSRSEFRVGDWQANIGNTAYTIYWEEDSSSRSTERVLTDAISVIQEECKSMAASKMRNAENVGFGEVRQSSFSCDTESGNLYSGVTVIDLGRTALIGMTVGTLETQEVVDIIDDNFQEDLVAVISYLLEEDAD